MQEKFEKNCNIVLLTRELVGNKIFAWWLAIEHSTHTLKVFFEKHVFEVRESSELFRLSLKALVGVEEPVSVEDACIRYVSLRSGGGRINILKSFWS